MNSPSHQATDQETELILSWESAAPTNLVANGGFELNFKDWLPAPWWRVSRDVTVGAPEGSAFVEIRPEDSRRMRGEGFLVATVTLPRRGAAARLTWKDHSTGLLNGRARIQVGVTPNGGSFNLLYDIAAGTEVFESWNAREVDLTPYRGRTFSLAFSLNNPSGELCSLRLDDIRIEIVPETIEYEVYVGPTPTLGSAQLLGKSTETTWNLAGLIPGSTYYWKIIQVTDGRREISPVFQFTVGGTPPSPVPALGVEMDGPQLHLRAMTQAGLRYFWEQAEVLEPSSWQTVGDEFLGDGLETHLNVPIDSAGRYFRLQVVSPN